MTNLLESLNAGSTNEDESNKILQNILNVIETHLGIDDARNIYVLELLAAYFENNYATKLAFEFLSTIDGLIEVLLGTTNYKRVGVLLECDC